MSVCQTPLVCKPISRTQTSVPLTEAKPHPTQKETRQRIKRSCLFTTQSNTKASPFPSLRVHSEHEGTNMKCKANCAPGRDIKQNQTGELLWRDTGRIHSQILASRSGLILARYSAGSTGKGTQRDTWRDPLASYSGILGGIHWRAALVGYSAGSTHKLLWRDARRDALASYSGILSGILGGIHWRAALVGYSAGSTGQLLWRDTRRDPLASRCGGKLGRIYWRAALAGYSAGSTGEQLWRDTGRDPPALAGYSAGSTGEPLWRDTRPDLLASRSGDTRRDPQASRSGGILGGIHWRAALAGDWAGFAGALLWRDTGWGRGVEASQTRIPT